MEIERRPIEQNLSRCEHLRPPFGSVQNLSQLTTRLSLLSFIDGAQYDIYCLIARTHFTSFFTIVKMSSSFNFVNVNRVPKGGRDTDRKSVV